MDIARIITQLLIIAELFMSNDDLMTEIGHVFEVDMEKARYIKKTGLESVCAIADELGARNIVEEQLKKLRGMVQ